jgi:hypothetical protein
MQLTSVQEAAFNAAGEAMTDIGEAMSLQRDKEGRFTGFAYATPGSYQGLVISKCCPTAAEAVADLLPKLEAERTKPKPLDAIALKEAVLAMVSDNDDLRSRIEELPVSK